MRLTNKRVIVRIAVFRLSWKFFRILIEFIGQRTTTVKNKRKNTSKDFSVKAARFMLESEKLNILCHNRRVPFMSSPKKRGAVTMNNPKVRNQPNHDGNR